MKAIAAVTATLAMLVLGTGVAHAHTGDVFDLDKYAAELKQHGLVEGEDYQDENQVIVMGLIDCNGIAEHKGSRDAWINSFKGLKTSTAQSMRELTIETDAAIDVFCPQFKH
jgi:hypothetical protein